MISKNVSFICIEAIYNTSPERECFSWASLLDPLKFGLCCPIYWSFKLSLSNNYNKRKSHTYTKLFRLLTVRECFSKFDLKFNYFSDENRTPLHWAITGSIAISKLSSQAYQWCRLRNMVTWTEPWGSLFTTLHLSGFYITQGDLERSNAEYNKLREAHAGWVSCVEVYTISLVSSHMWLSNQ